MTRARDGERGLTIIEALVIATITALLALLLMPLLPRSAGRAFAVADRSVDVLDEMRAEREFRLLVRSVSPRATPDQQPLVPMRGGATSVAFYPALQAMVACGRAGAPMVQLVIDASGIACLSEGHNRSLLRLRRGSAAVLAYSADGSAWQSTWIESASAPYVRLALYDNGRLRDAWVEQAAGGAP